MACNTLQVLLPVCAESSKTDAQLVCVYCSVAMPRHVNRWLFIQQLLHVCFCRFAAMHQGNPIHTFMFDKEGMLLSANPAALQRRPSGKLVHLHSLLSTSSPATAHIHSSRIDCKAKTVYQSQVSLHLQWTAASAPYDAVATPLHGKKAALAQSSSLLLSAGPEARVTLLQLFREGDYGLPEAEAAYR